jgi:hypothetical protein
MDSFNPHKDSPVASNLYCWRIGNTRSWAKAVYETDTKALEAAKEHCKNRLGVGKYTIHIGVTKTEPVNCEPIIKRYKQHLEYGWDNPELFRAMAIPKEHWKRLTNEIAELVTNKLVEASALSSNTQISKVKHHYFTVSPSDIGIEQTGIESLLNQIKTEYRTSKTDWHKVDGLQTLLIQQAQQLIEKHQHPFFIKALMVWQGYERTKSRLHIVCNSSIKVGRFSRDVNDTLCKKSPSLVEEAENTQLPCIACLERLLKLSSEGKK